VPVPAAGITQADRISAGGESSCAVLVDGSVQCWGGNQSGQLGDGTATDSNVPVTVSGITDATAVSVGYGRACALLGNGAVQCWGGNGRGELGHGTSDHCPNHGTSTSCSMTPVTVTGF
jgi:alpha-tubulin suppressor-like RCC1 family protein